MEHIQQAVKEWAVGVDPEVDVQVLPAHDDPRERGEIIPIRLGRHGYHVTIGFPERMLAEFPLSAEARKTLQQGVRQLIHREARASQKPSA
jgi:hypothetical protein